MLAKVLCDSGAWLGNRKPELPIFSGLIGSEKGRSNSTIQVLSLRSENRKQKESKLPSPPYRIKSHSDWPALTIWLDPESETGQA